MYADADLIRREKMINWKNLDTLYFIFEELKQVEKVNLAQVMSGESGASA